MLTSLSRRDTQHDIPAGIEVKTTKGAALISLMHGIGEQRAKGAKFVNCGQQKLGHASCLMLHRPRVPRKVWWRMSQRTAGNVCFQLDASTGQRSRRLEMKHELPAQCLTFDFPSLLVVAAVILLALLTQREAPVAWPWRHWQVSISSSAY
jgi:hypothetical protein